MSLNICLPGEDRNHNTVKTIWLLTNDSGGHSGIILILAGFVGLAFACVSKWRHIAGGGGLKWGRRLDWAEVQHFSLYVMSFVFYSSSCFSYYLLKGVYYVFGLPFQIFKLLNWPDKMYYCIPFELRMNLPSCANFVVWNQSIHPPLKLLILVRVMGALEPIPKQGTRLGSSAAKMTMCIMYTVHEFNR